MDTRLFGPPAWRLLHGLPWRSDLRLAAPLIYALADVLPCIHCRQSFRALLRIDPIQDQTDIDLAHWLNRIHNAVNRKLAKPDYPFIEVLLHPVTDKDWRQAMNDFASVVALNYNPKNRASVERFFSILGKTFNFHLPEESFESQDSLYSALIRTLEIPDQREIIEKIKVQ